MVSSDFEPVTETKNSVFCGVRYFMEINCESTGQTNNAASVKEVLDVLHIHWSRAQQRMDYAVSVANPAGTQGTAKSKQAIDQWSDFPMEVYTCETNSVRNRQISWRFALETTGVSVVSTQTTETCRFYSVPTETENILLVAL